VDPLPPEPSEPPGPLPAPPVSAGPTTITLVSVLNDPSLLLRTMVVVMLVFPPEGLLVVVEFLLPVVVPFLPGGEVMVEL